MTRSSEPAVYRLRVDGHLDDHWSAWFDGFTLAHENNGTTSLSGFVPDQAALHGLLMKVRDLGITLISLEVLPTQLTRTRLFTTFTYVPALLLQQNA